METVVSAMRYCSQIVHPFILYLAAINTLAFGVFSIDCMVAKLSNHGNAGYFHGSILTPLAAIGGAAGMLAALTLFARHHINKHNVAWWFCGFVCLILWIVVVLIWSEVIVIDFSSLHIPNMSILVGIGIYLIIINVLTFALLCFDKVKAYQHGFRLREFNLLGLGLMGGSVGGILAMRLIRHKTAKWYFTIGFPVFAVLQVGLLVLAYGAGVF